MIHESRKVEVTKNIALGGIYYLCNLWCLFVVLGDFFHFLHQQLVVARVLDIAINAREDLRRVAH